MTRPSKRKTKKEELIQMLTRKAGADVAMISDKLGWQTHTTRAALTGLRKAGYEVLGEKPDEGKPKRYRISATPAKAGKTAGVEATDARQTRSGSTAGDCRLAGGFRVSSAAVPVRGVHAQGGGL